ncbi:PREDICTED: uncharacterized protein LOC106751350, partial [Dinoponera quadriceps]|uniref:Uncharacterized protein LOC106751350 n=1 Tax=Dinoponera quadriceps TaxID=609295 RepID=A0A6P3Y9M0_DINQU
MPNLGGPSVGARRLYAGALQAMILYGAPVWAGRAAESPLVARLLRAVQRPVALRVARAYRTTSYVAATLLAGLPPLELLALKYREIFLAVRELRGRGDPVSAGAIREVKRRAHASLLEAWSARLQAWGQQRGGEGGVVRAILPNLKGWLERGFAPSFHATQVLTGHGCFGEYLCRIGREASARCHHCGDERDTARHTLVQCPAWGVERRALSAVVGSDVGLPAIMSGAVGDPAVWAAFSVFSGSVMRRKEEAERAREREGLR